MTFSDFVTLVLFVLLIFGLIAGLVWLVDRSNDSAVMAAEAACQSAEEAGLVAFLEGQTCRILLGNNWVTAMDYYPEGE